MCRQSPRWWQWATAAACLSAAAAAALGTEPLDTITFASPEARHLVETVNCTAEPTPGAPADNSVALSMDRVHGGRVTFVMAVNGSAQNHLTVKLWGGVSVVNGTPFVTQQNTWLLDPDSNFSKQYGWAHCWPCELDQADPSRGLAATGTFPGRWEYATFPIPTGWTSGRSSVRLGLGTGLFQWYGGPEFNPSRALFRAYTHTAPYLAIPASESQGAEPPDAPPKPSVPARTLSEHLAAQVGAAVQGLFDAQVWNWTDVEAGRMPRCLFGAPSKTGFRCQLQRDGRANASACKSAWQGGDDSGNLPWSTSLLALGAAHNSSAPWAANFSGRRWVLDRVVGALDVHVRAQGSNGGFRRNDGAWVGGPNRTTAGNPLEGWGHTGVARAFALCHGAMEAEGILDEGVDDDDNPATPNVTRRTAYLTMFNASRSYLYTAGATWCPNQELGDAKGVWAANHAVALLAPEMAWPEGRVLDDVVLPALGLVNFSDMMWNAKNRDYPRPPGNWVTISPAGISLEAIGSLAGGYSDGYSDILDALDVWASWANTARESQTLAAISTVLGRMAPAFAHFRHESNCVDPPGRASSATLWAHHAAGGATDGAIYSGAAAGRAVKHVATPPLPPAPPPPPPPYRCLRNTGFITWRNNIDPGMQRTPIAPFTSLVLRDQVYQRELQLRFRYAGDMSVFPGLPASKDAHWISEITNAIPLAENLDALLALPPSPARLPHEDDAPDFAWADNVGRSVAAKHGRERLFATLQWRHDTNSHSEHFAPTVGKPVTANGICRVQLLEANRTVNRLATVTCSPGAGGPLAPAVHTLAFGGWLVGVNSDLYVARPFAVPDAYVGRAGLELVTGKDMTSLPRQWTLGANQTVVVRLLDDVTAHAR